MQLKAPNHRTIVAKCTDLRHQEPGLQLKQRNDKGLRRAVQAIQYMFHVQAFLQPNCPTGSWTNRIYLVTHVAICLLRKCPQ